MESPCSASSSPWRAVACSEGAWTWIADVYAVALLFMATSGMFVLRGRTGLAGRGKWLVGAGILIPVVALVVAGVG